MTNPIEILNSPKIINILAIQGSSPDYYNIHIVDGGNATYITYMISDGTAKRVKDLIKILLDTQNFLWKAKQKCFHNEYFYDYKLKIKIIKF